MRRLRVIVAVLATALLTLGLAGPAHAAAPTFFCDENEDKIYCNVHNPEAGYAGLTSVTGGNWKTFITQYRPYDIKLRVYASNGNVTDYDADNYTIYYSISHIRVWLVGYGLGPAVNVP